MNIKELESLNDPQYYWDKRAYLKVKNFFEKKLFHSEGQFAGKPFILNSWQDEFIANVFGVKCKDTPENREAKRVGLRRYSSAAIWIPKGGGKTEFAAGLALYGASSDGEMGAEGYVAAKSKNQAEICYGKGVNFVNNNPDLKIKFEESYSQLVYHRVLRNKTSGEDFNDICRFGAISSEGKNQHGKSPHIAVLDELWNQTNNELYTALSGSMRSRLQPLFITISTAGERKNEFAFGRWEADMKCYKDPNHNKSHYAVIYCADANDDWNDEATWYKANPSLGVTPTLEHLRREYRKAKEDPILEKAFKQFHLNLWVQSTTAWINYGEWEAGRVQFNEDELKGCQCYLGCDLSITTDFTALTLALRKENDIYLLNRFFMPLELINRNSFIDQVSYDKWALDGWITPCGITEINQTELENEIMAWFEKFGFGKALFDAALAANLMVRLDSKLPYIGKFPQTFTGFSKAAPFFYKLVKEKRLKHFNPVLDWMAQNVEVAQSGNFIKPVKPSGVRGRNMRIDGIVSSIMAVSPFRDGEDADIVKDVSGMVWTI